MIARLRFRAITTHTDISRLYVHSDDFADEICTYVKKPFFNLFAPFINEITVYFILQEVSYGQQGVVEWRIWQAVGDPNPRSSRPNSTNLPAHFQPFGYKWTNDRDGSF